MSRRLGFVNIFTPRTVQLNRLLVGGVRNPDRKTSLAVTEGSWASSKVTLTVLFQLIEKERAINKTTIEV